MLFGHQFWTSKDTGVEYTIQHPVFLLGLCTLLIPTNNNMKHKLLAALAAFVMVASVSAGPGSFGGGSRSSSSFGGSSSSHSSSFGGSSSRSSYSSIPSSSSSNFSGTNHVSTGSFGRSGVMPASGSTRSSSSYSRPTSSYSVRSRYAPGYRPSVSVHYYGYGGSPLYYGGRRIYWYGNGYYSYDPGGPLIMGNSGMPGYQAAYGYDPSGTVVVSNAGGGFTTLWVIISLIAIVVLIGIFARAFNS